MRPGAAARGWSRAPRLRPQSPSYSHPRRLSPDALSRSHLRVLVFCAQAVAVAVSGLYAYVTASYSASLVVVDISNPLSPVIRGSVVSSSLGDVGVALRCVHLARVRVLKLSRALTRSLSCAVHTQASGVAVSGLYAYVAAEWSDSLVVVDISNLASPVIRGSVVSSSLLDGVRGARSCGRGSPWAPRHAPVPSIAPAALSPAEARALTCCAHRRLASR